MDRPALGIEGLMRKTYESLTWDEARLIVGKAHAIGVLGDALLSPVEVEGKGEPDWDLTILFAHFDLEIFVEPVEIVERRVEFAPVEGVREPNASPVSERDPEVVEAWASESVARVEAREALVNAASVEVVEEGPPPEAYDPEDVPPVEVEPVTTKPGPPAEPEGAGTDLEPSKTCTRCGERKSLSKFNINRARKDGRTAKCSECSRAYQREQRERRKEERRAMTERGGRDSSASPKGNGAGAASLSGANARRTLREQRERERIEREAAFIEERDNGQDTEPERIAAQPRGTEKVERFCSNGEECVCYAQLDGPQKLTSGNTDGRCFACQDSEIGRPGFKGHIVRHAADGSTHL